jgi:di/tricarboxylate transporter
VNPITITLVILALAVIAFISHRIPVGLVAIGVALALWATGILSLNTALSGFGDPTVLFIASLFVVTEGLDATGVTAWVGQQVIGRAGKNPSRLLVIVMLLGALVTSLISVNAAVAALIPVAVLVGTRVGMSTSKLLIPLAFAAHAGSILALTGTPVNIIVSEFAVDSGAKGFGFFEFALVGIPLVIGTVLIMWLFGQGLLPSRTPHSMPRDLSEHAHVLLDHYLLPDSSTRLKVLPRSSLIGSAREALDLSAFDGVRVLNVQSRYGEPKESGPIVAGDILMVRGPRASVDAFAAADRLSTQEALSASEEGNALVGVTHGVTEVVIPPRSTMIGTTVFPGMITDSGDLVILAVHRNGRDVEGETALTVGDSLLLQGSWSALDRHSSDPAVLVVDAPQQLRRQAVPLGERSGRAIVILLLFVAALASGLLPAAVVGLLAAGAMILTRVVSVTGAYRSISWTTVVLIGGMIPLSTAFIDTGTADFIARGLINILGASGPLVVLLGIVILTVVLGQLISNTATVLIVAPIAIAVASELGVSSRPFLMALTVAGAAAFLTPIATPANMMVMGPGAYKFGDYWKLGLPLLVFFVIVATFYVPLIWHF